MASHFYAMLSRMKNIYRWGLMRNTRRENLSEHSLETAQIAHALALIGNKRFGKNYDPNYAATDENLCDLTIGFLEPEAFRDSFSFLNGEDANGAVQFWYYTDSNEVHTASIGYRTDIDQITRSSILIEEVVNMLGISDTLLRPDSIIASEYSEPQALTEIDEVILKLLYHPDIRCGMDAAQCEEVIRQLYY